MDGLQRAMSSYLLDFCGHELKARNVKFTPEKSISTAKVVEVVNYASRDLERIADGLPDGVSRVRYAAYYAFWFAKIAPLSLIYRSDIPTVEIVDINERIAVILAVDLIVNSIGQKEVPSDIQKLEVEAALSLGAGIAPVPLIWKKCEKTCAGACFKAGVQKYMSFHSFQNFEYLVHSLRHRGVGPYFLVTTLESLVVGSCEGEDPFR